MAADLHDVSGIEKEGLDVKPTINSNVTQRGGAVILDVGIWRVEEADEDRNCASVDELLPILICTCQKRCQIPNAFWTGMRYT